MKYRWLRIDWSGPLTKPWRTWLDDILRDAYGSRLREALNRPGPLHKHLGLGQ